MSDSENFDRLRELQFFQGIDETYLRELAGLSRQREFPARTKVFEEYERAKEVYFIVEGAISLAICGVSGCRQITVVGRGDLMGWSPLIGRARLFDTARTTTPVKALMFDGDELVKFCKAHADFGFEFMRRAACVLGERLSDTRRQLLEMGGIHLPEFQLESD